MKTLLFAVISGVVFFIWFFSNQPSENLNPTVQITPSQTPKKASLLEALLKQSPTSAPTPTLPPIPNQKILIGGTQIFQTFNNCGPASLSMALSHHGITVSQQTLGTAIRPYQNTQGDNDDKSVTLAELAQKATEYGFITYHRPVGDIVLLQQFIAHDMPVITRTWLKPGEDIGHYRVVKGYDNSKKILVQDDSLQGKNLEYSYDDFNELWQAFNYEFLVVVPAEKQAIAAQILGEKLDSNIAWQKALELAQTQTDRDPNDLYAQFNQVVALYHLSEYGSAVTLYEKIESQLPKRMLWYQIEPILAYSKLGQDDQVLRISEQIFTGQNRAFSELHWLRGEIFEKRGQTEQATAAFKLAKTYNAREYWKTNLQ